MNIPDVLEGIQETMIKAKAPLSERQKMLLAGALAVYLDKAYAEGAVSERFKQIHEESLKKKR